MALSPSIPTSFVPKQPVSATKRPQSSGSNIILIASLALVAVAIVAAGGIYLYATYLNGVVKSKAAQVTAAENNVNPDTVEQFVRLRDRLTAADTLLNQHIELSQFFTLLEDITLQNVQFNDLKIDVAADNSATIEMSGSAADFNALAAESTTFAAQKQIKNAIFSGIAINKDGTVSFTIDANLDPSIVTEGAAPSTPALLPAATSSSTPSATSFSNNAVTTAPLSSSSSTPTLAPTSSSVPPANVPPQTTPSP